METAHPSGNRFYIALSILCFLYSSDYLIPSACAASFAGGTGEPNAPYQIATAEDLVSIGSDPNLVSRHFVLVADIDLDPNLPGGTVFTQAVICSDYQFQFTGCLDGRGHVIRNLIIIQDQPVGPLGLFGWIGKGGVVKDLHLDNVRITCVGSVGGLAGSNAGEIVSCSLIGSVTCTRFFAGGLVGTNSGIIRQSQTAGTVEASAEVGGLVGHNISGTISYCHSAGSVHGTATVGGLVGWNAILGTIAFCYSTSSVKGQSYVGGLVGGVWDGTISSCYATGPVTGQTGQTGYVGGLIGSLVGVVVPYLTILRIEDCYFLAQADGGGPDNGIGTDLSTDQMKQQGSFVGWDFWGTKDDGFKDDWSIKDSYPILSWQTGLLAIPDLSGLTLEEAGRVLEAAGLVLAADVQTDFNRTVPQGCVLQPYYPRVYALPGDEVELLVSLGPYDWATNPGDGTADRPYEIRTASQLDGLMDHPGLWDRHFVQTADINMADRTYSTALIAMDIHDANDFQGTAFTGHFDGQGFQILNLGITTETNDYLGLFGLIGQGATVKKVNLVNTRVQGGGESFYVGTLAGYSAGTVTDCSATGEVYGRRDYVDRLIGKDFGVSANNNSNEVYLIRYSSEP